MFDPYGPLSAPEVKSKTHTRGAAPPISFKKKRQDRKKSRLKRNKERALSLTKTSHVNREADTGYVGPTKETLAKLTEDPLVVFRKKNILNDEEIWAFKRIRRAIQIITNGTEVRTSRFNAVSVQVSRFDHHSESDYEINIKDHYNHWIDRMTAKCLQAGPVLDIIIDELSLSAIDRKWGKRKGWAKTHLKSSLRLYGLFSAPNNRHK